MSVRVIAGTAKGRRLRVPDLPGCRPTTDRVKQILFDLLTGDVPGARVIDAYAGTGALGIEALSRGAASVVFVEANPKAAAAVRENLATCGFEAEVIVRPLADALAGLDDFAYDLALVDPPYATGLGSLVAALEALAEKLAHGATVAVEAPPGLVLPRGYLERRRRRAGSTELVVADR